MAFLRSSLVSDVPNAIRGERVILRAPQVSDYGPWAELGQKAGHICSPGSQLGRAMI